MNANTQKRRGMTAVLAMLYLVLLSTMAAGFYAATNSHVHVADNERRTAAARLAAESGMEFIRYHLAQVVIPHGTLQSELFNLIYNHLDSTLTGTANLGTRDVSWHDDTVRIPADGWMNLDSSGAQFYLTVQDLGQKVRVKVVGRGTDPQIVRGVQMDYDLAERASRVFDYGVASKGKIWTDGASRIKGATDPTKGSVLSTCMTDPTPVVIRGKEVSGDISISNPWGNVVVDGATVGGETSTAEIVANHIHKGVEPPEFPTIDTEAFAVYATNTYSSAEGDKQTLVNCRIPANTNPKFTGTTTIQGVLYIETPNNVDFGGGVDIQGAIVVQNNPTGNPSTNVLYFKGNVSATGVETLPESFGNLRQLTGAFILAPTFATYFTGNFGTINGSIISSRLGMAGNAGGTIKGTVINVADSLVSLTGSSEIIIASTGTSNYPAGVFFSSRYVPLPDTYEEVKP